MYVSEGERSRIHRRTVKVVMVGQVLGGAGLAAGVTVGALLAEDMLGTEGLAGLPAALFTLGSALAAYLVGGISERAGRRIGLTLGFAAGGLGAAGVVVAAATDSVPLLFVALLVYGAGTATNLQARYAGADLATPATRGTAISAALVATTLGAVAGPNLVEPLGHLATGLGLPALSGPFLLAAVAYSAAGTALFALLRPDPLLLARRLEDERRALAPPAQASEGMRPVAPPVGRGAHVGATIMVLTQITMVAVMTMTPVHMRAHHHGMSDVGLVIGLHIAAMYLPSPITGLLVDRIGRSAVAAASGVVLLAAGGTAAAAPGDSLGLLILALVLLGLGWNLGLISGTTLVVDATEPSNRPRTQGRIDVLVALAGASGGALSGIVVALTSYPALAIGGGLLALALIPALLWATPGRRAR
ncbi:MFS transporter [Nocardioides sp. IC4_145]|uniref:MFS transporter n=1 Tax=Nocardioides sp. IC4_145 TaxID=2714037 RepID=UPI00140C101A|nr:MFS transporter [Nocardioides sp. IC4_145]NHC21918.1 MFS transporter [Nocardioides sp. IC4_145]